MAGDVRIVVERSSAHPMTYAVMLVVKRGSAWRTVRTFDNSHDVEEHHDHGYVGSEKQDPTITHGDPNDALGAALLKLRQEWADIVRKWDKTHDHH